MGKKWQRIVLLRKVWGLSWRNVFHVVFVSDPKLAKENTK
jgi:hypothetical protein